VISRLHLRHFRGFEKFTVDFPNPAVLIGANNAGKSTIIAALRLATLMLRQGKRLRATHARRVRGDEIRVHEFTSEQFDLQDENLRFEFRSLETSFSLVFDNGSQLIAVWPKSQKRAYFYFQNAAGATLEVPGAVDASFSTIGTIPPLSPIDLREERLSTRWVQQNLTTRLSSRHFRNQLLALTTTGRWREFLTFCQKTAGLSLEAPRVQEVDDQSSIDVYCHDGRGPKEVAWVGDGIQVFLQLLLHLFRLQGTQTIVLDEPEVYLHADLQHKLLRVLDSVTSQFVIATHSAEIVSGIEVEKVVLVDKSNNRSKRISGSADLVQLGQTLGSAFNLQFVRALRTNMTLFVEGKDLLLLRNIADTVGASHLANEDGIVVAQLGGVGNWETLKGLPLLTDSILEGAVNTFVLLDRDTLSDAERTARRQQLRQAGLRAHIWERRELESYLIEPSAIARLVSMSPSEINVIVEEELEALYNEIEDAVIAARIKGSRGSGLDPKTIIRAARTEVRDSWTTLDDKLKFCPAKPLMHRVNKRIQATNSESVSWPTLSRAILLNEIPDEMCRVLMNIEELLLDPAAY
jgi:energy-coupling factor transporter ATP-binding protein EcfA2